MLCTQHTLGTHASGVGNGHLRVTHESDGGIAQARRRAPSLDKGLHLYKLLPLGTRPSSYHRTKAQELRKTAYSLGWTVMGSIDEKHQPRPFPPPP